VAVKPARLALSKKALWGVVRSLWQCISAWIPPVLGYISAVDMSRIAKLAEELRAEASSERAIFGVYREAHEEDAFARATTDGVVLFAAELLDGLTRLDNPMGNNLIALDDDTSYHDAQADLHLHAVEVFGSDLAPPRKRKLRIARKEYAAVLGCLVALVLTTIFALAGAYFLGNWALRAIW